MNRAELQGAIDRVVAGIINPDAENHSLAYWRTEIEPQQLRYVATRSRQLADDLESLCKAQESARAVIEGRA